METKSRYEVISDLDRQKRDLIRERDGMNDTLRVMEKQVKDVERQRDDTVVVLDRKISDKQKEIEDFKSEMEDKKTTIQTLIDSVDASLERFKTMSASKQA